MAAVKEHYQTVLSKGYSWVYGGLDCGIQRNSEYFVRNRIAPTKSNGESIAVDLGAGSGFQSIPLAQLGYSVVSIDADESLLEELKGHVGTHSIRVLHDDLRHFDTHIESPVELIVCMTDTILHLESPQQVAELFAKIAGALVPGGQFILSFRDLSNELKECDRFIPVRSDENTIFTCFLEYEPETCKVHDIVYSREDGQWLLEKSFYRKLRISREWVIHQLGEILGLDVQVEVDRGMIFVISSA